MTSASLGAKRQMLFYGLGIVVMKGTSFLMLPVVTHYLPASHYGQLDILLTWMNVLAIIMGFGLAEALYKFSASTKTPEVVFNATLQLNILLMIPLLLLCFAFSEQVQAWLPGQLTTDQVTLALWSTAVATSVTLPLCWLRLQGKADIFFYLSAGKSVIQALTTWYFLTQGYAVEGVLYSSLLSHLILVLLLLWFVPLQWRLLALLPLTRAILRYSLPLVFSGVCLFMVFGAERWIIAGLMDAQTLAQYAIAIQFALMVAVCCEPFTLWWYPKRMGLLKTTNGLQQIAQTAALGCVLAFGFALLIGFIGPLVIQFLLPESYHAAAQWVPILCLAMALKQCSHILNTGCYISDSTSSVGNINFWLALIAPVLFYLAGFTDGLRGITIASVLLYLIRLGWFYQVSQSKLKLAYPLLTLLTVAILCSFALLILPWFSIPTATLIVLLACIVSAWLLRLTYQQFQSLQNAEALS